MTRLVLSRVSKNALVHWFGNNEDESELYVPICLSDWDDDASTASIDEEDIDDYASTAKESILENEQEDQTILWIYEVSGVADNLFADDLFEEDPTYEEEDQRLKECREDMSLQGSLDGE